MKEFINQAVREIEHGGPHIHFIAFILFEILGVLAFHWLFRILIPLLARITRTRRDSWRSTFKFMDVCLGLMVGCQCTKYLVNVPWFITNLLDKHFHSLVVFTVTFFCAHLLSSVLKAHLSRSESESSSMSILTTVIDLAVYMAGFLIILSSYGISISPLLTALGAGGLASALALQDTLVPWPICFPGSRPSCPIKSVWATISACPADRPAASWI